MKSISTAIAVSESENTLKLIHGQKRRKKRKELNAYLTKRKPFNNNRISSGAQVHLLDNEDYTDDSYTENIRKPENHCKFKSKAIACNIFVALWTFSWIIGTIISVWLFFDIKKQFAHFQIEINKLKNNNTQFPIKLEQELKFLHQQFQENILDLQTQIANGRKKFEEFDTLKKSYQELEFKFQKHVDNNHVRNS